MQKGFNFIRKISSKPKECSYFITSPIFYVNAAPHIGHLYTTVICDAIYRFQRLLGAPSDYIFSTGTDEHGTKIQQAASKYGIPEPVYCNNISEKYKKLFADSGVAYTDFIRTTEDRHQRAVHNFWNRLADNGHIYKTKYQGWYCVSDETFLTESQMKMGENGLQVSLESGHPVEWTEEENYMFPLSNFQDKIIQWIQSDSDRIRPKKFKAILLDSLKEPLPNVSISRPTSRVHWGIQVPNDQTQSIYVWLDALVNYLTVTGYPSEKFRNYWPANVQVIGKDILKFHAIYWPGFLLAADLEPPDSVFVHSHWTVDGQKMSKSKNNVVNPNERAELYTYEGLRYFLLREGVAHSDGNYSDTKIFRILNSELADTLGNLLSRCCGKSLNPQQIFPLFDRNEFDELSNIDITKKLIDKLTELPAICLSHYKANNFYMVVDQVIAALHLANNFVETTKPWELKKTGQINRLNAVLCISMESLRICGIILQPIVPDMSRKLLDKLSVNGRLWKDLESNIWSNVERPSVDTNLGSGNSILFHRIRTESIDSIKSIN